MITTILFDVGDTLVRAAAPGTPVAQLAAEPLDATVLPVLAALARGKRLGAVTDTAVMTGADVRAALGGSGIGEHLEVVVTSSDIGVAKPDPAGVLAACRRLGADPAEVLYVGDADVDEGAARAAGTAFARVDARGLADAVRRGVAEADGALAAARALVGEPDHGAAASAVAHHGRLTKPAGSLGRLESLGVQLAAIAGQDPPPRPEPAAVAVFAGDHGVVEAGVTPWPQEVTGQMVANFVAGGAAINVLARQAGATVTVVDVGVASDLDALGLSGAPGLLRRRVRPGTADLAAGPAMTRAEARQALDVGAEVADHLVAAGARALVTGEMGIGNTTPSAALIAAITGRSASDVTGRGTGIDDATLARKIVIVERALARVTPDADPVDLLAEVGGLEIAALAGFMIAGASHRVPVVVDGVIAGAGLLVAHALCPAVLPFVVAGHRSTEPGAGAVLAHLGLEPVLDLELRLGEGSGACLALGVLDAAALVLQEMATFDTAGVKEA